MDRRVFVLGTVVGAGTLAGLSLLALPKWAKNVLKNKDTEGSILKRSRLSGKRAEDFILVIAFALAILGIVISVLSLAFINHEFTQQLFTQRQTFVFVFMGGVTVFAVIMSGPNLSTPKHYRFVLQKLESKRNNLVKKVKDAETQ